MIEEKEIIKGCVSGNPAYQKMFYQRYCGTVMRICLRYAGSRQDADDLFQDSFIKIFLNLKGYRGEGSLEGWVKRITTHTAIDFLRKKRELFSVIKIEEMTTEIAEVTIPATTDIPVDVMLQMVRELPVGYRTVFNMFVMDDYKQEEIAKIIGCSHATVRSQVFKAKRLLRKKMELYLNNKDNGNL